MLLVKAARAIWCALAVVAVLVHVVSLRTHPGPAPWKWPVGFVLLVFLCYSVFELGRFFVWVFVLRKAETAKDLRDCLLRVLLACVPWMLFGLAFRFRVSDRVFIASHREKLDAILAGESFDPKPFREVQDDQGVVEIVVGSSGMGDTYRLYYDRDNRGPSAVEAVIKTRWAGFEASTLCHVDGGWYSVDD
jgi:hypothetical protein